MNDQIVEKFATDIAATLGTGRLRNSDMSLTDRLAARPLPDQKVLFGLPIEVSGRHDGRDFRTSAWIGLNVRRVFTIYSVDADFFMHGDPSRFDECVNFLQSKIYKFTFGGAEKVGFSPYFQFCGRDDHTFVSIWLTALVKDPILPSSPDWTFWTNDVAMQTLSFIQTTLDAGLNVQPTFPPTPL